MQGLDILTQNFILEEGIWRGKLQNKLSYPQGGNQLCYQLEDNSYWFNHRNEVISWAVKKYFNGDLFLDVGGGNGYVTSRLQADGINSILIEPGTVGCLNAQKRGLQNIINATLEEIKLPNSSIPAVGFFDVIEHLEDDKIMLNNVHQLLNKSGLLFITVPALPWLWSHEDEDAGHFRRYSLSSLNELLVETGFNPLFESYLFSILKWPVYFLRTMPTKFGFKKLLEAKNEHNANNGFSTSLIKRSLLKELQTLRNGEAVKTGTSCFVVAQKQ